MAIYLPASAEEQDISLDELTPREIVSELDKHVVGQICIYTNDHITIEELNG